MQNSCPLEYGNLAPRFELKSADGQPFSRNQFRNKSGLVLIFFQAVAQIQSLLDQVSRDQAEYLELNTRVFGIGHATSDQLKQASHSLGLSFTLLADPDGAAWRAYSQSDLPGYAVFVLDIYGGVEAQRVSQSANQLPDAQTILAWTRSAQYKCSI
jgi:peroxiredoxin